jgi:hypothetical protein
MTVGYTVVSILIFDNMEVSFILPALLYVFLCGLYIVFGLIGESVSGGVVISDTKVTGKTYFKIIFASTFFVSIYNAYSGGTLTTTAVIGFVSVLAVISYGVLGWMLDINDPYEPIRFYVLYIFIPTVVIGLILAALGYFIGEFLFS